MSLFFVFLFCFYFFACGSNLHDGRVLIYKRHDRREHRGLGIEINKEKSDCLKRGESRLPAVQPANSSPRKKTNKPRGGGRREGKRSLVGETSPLLSSHCSLLAVRKVARYGGNTTKRAVARRRRREREFLRSVVKRKEAPNWAEDKHTEQVFRRTSVFVAAWKTHAQLFWLLLSESESKHESCTTKQTWIQFVFFFWLLYSVSTLPY